MSFRDWVNTPIANRPSDAPSGGGARGGWQRFGAGFQQGLIPSRGQVLMRGVNPAAYLMGGIAEGVGDAVRGSAWYQALRERIGSDRPPVPSQRPSRGGAETFGLGEDQIPAEILANPAWVDEWIRNGSGPLPSRAPPLPQGNRVGAGRGTTIAQGPAAQAMFDSMRANANASQTRSQARNAMSNMFAGEER